METTGEPLDDTNRSLLAEIQRRIPIDHRPFEVLGEKLGLSEQECLERVARLKAQGVIQELTALFDLPSLGYQSTLVAMSVEPGQLDEAMAVVSQYPGVSRAYACRDRFNLWFAIAVPPDDSLTHVMKVLHRLSHAQQAMMLPVLKVYRSDWKAGLVDQAAWLEGMADLSDERRPAPTLTDADIRRIRIVQEELPLLELPYSVWAEQAEMTEPELFAWARRMEHLGYLQRIAAVARHSGGWTSHMMVLWEIPEDEVDVIGGHMALFREVTHCCRRSTSIDWPYPLYTFVRAQTQQGCSEVVERIQRHIGRFPEKRIGCVKEYKSVRVRCCAEAFDAWRDAVRPAADLLQKPGNI